MWYFSWILGTGFALAFAVLNAMWYEITDRANGDPESGRAPPAPPPTAARRDP